MLDFMFGSAQLKARHALVGLLWVLCGCTEEAELTASRRERIDIGLAGGAEVFSDCALGSGFFFLNEGDVYVLTNEHVTRGARKAPCSDAALRVRTKSGRVFAVIAEHVDRKHDLAVLKVFAGRANVPGEIIPLVIDHRVPRDKEPIVIVGSPNEGGLVALDGLVTRARSSLSSKMELNVSVQPGQSGGPVISKRTGLVVGVVTSRSQDVLGKEGVSAGLSYAVAPDALSRFLRSIDWVAIRLAGCPSGASCRPGYGDAAAPPAVVTAGGADRSRKSFRARILPVEVEPAVYASLIRAAAITPALYAVLVAAVLSWSRLPEFALVCLAGAYLLYLAGNWLMTLGAMTFVGQAMPALVAISVAWCGILVVAHALLRTCLAGFLFATRSSAIDSRGIRLKVGLMFRPWIASSLMIPILAGAWVVIAYQTIWLAG